MKGARIIVIVVAVAAIAIAAALSLGGGSKKPSGSSQPAKHVPAANGEVKVTLAYSPEKEKMLTPLVQQFNGEQHLAGRKTIVVDAQNWSSGDAETKIAKGRFQPTVWSPSSSLWGRLLNFEADRRYVADSNPSLVRTPLVIAMWEPLARAIGWPGKQVGFKEILDLATGNRSWASYGHPELPSFRLGHTNPDYSTSGLSFVAAQYYSATGKKEGLTVADVNNKKVRAYAQAIESSIVHYGDTTLFFADQLKAHGPGYASAVAMEEVTMLDFNQTRPAGVDKLVALYPAEGTFYSDDPYLVLNAPWVSAGQKRAAAVFGAWLEKKLTPQLAATYGFRPGDPNLKPGAPITKANGANPALPTRLLALPEPRVLAKIKAAWHADRKPANVMLVVDTSGSMYEEGKLAQAKRGLQVFLKQLSPRDRVGLTWFNDSIHKTVQIAPFSTNRGLLVRTVDALAADGNTAVYDATSEGIRDVAALSDNSRINAVVVLTDGQDTASHDSLADVISSLRSSGDDETHKVRVFTIAYGSSADEQALAQIAEAGGGKAYVGNPHSIEKVYISISSFF